MTTSTDYHELARQLAPFLAPWISSSQGYGQGSRVFRSTNQSIPNNAVTAITFDTERRDRGNFWVVGSPTRLTAPVDGFYLMGGTVVLDANATGVRGLYIFVNGAFYCAALEVPAGGTAARGTALTVASAYFLPANNYAELHVYQNSGGALNALFLTGYSSEFWMIKIG